mmetsp:Transcript_5041/g.11226  ORF Transcript_5041/g.11226 Transcript_5041/m.11226 type:complete len:296 (+) Transcript_5041:110-997(+)
MSTNGKEDIADKSAVKLVLGNSDPLSSNHHPASKEDDNDDPIKPIQKSLTNESNPLDDSDDFDDMESLLHSTNVVESGEPPARTTSKVGSLNIDDGNDDYAESNTNGIMRKESSCCGLVKSTRRVGNMRILFPEYLHSSGWGVVGPHTFGPVVVWLLLVVATHGVIRGINRHDLGIASVAIAYLFLGITTYRLTDVSYRDPGICLDQEIPGHEPPDRASQYRFCDRCNVWQPPDGVHCPECNVCVAGYDHHCVWMGTCIGKKNYRQFVRFNLTWLLYVLYAFLWVLTVGPLITKK